MGFEFAAQLPADVSLDLESIAQSLRNSGRYEIESQSPSELKLRYAKQPRCDEWPEDIAISLEGSQLYVLVHAGTKTQRALLLDDLAKAVSIASNRAIVFNEL
ncbi:MAG TPA: hypothetical protein VE422_45275 [Terriglobia bacterium]|nr:hypothetical protein [Terriglobia bacterium]